MFYPFTEQGLTGCVAGVEGWSLVVVVGADGSVKRSSRCHRGKSSKCCVVCEQHHRKDDLRLAGT